MFVLKYELFKMNRIVDVNRVLSCIDVKPSTNEPISPVISQGHVVFTIKSVKKRDKDFGFEGLRHILLHLLIVTLMVSIGMMDIFSHLLTIILCGSVLLSHRLAPQRKNSGVLPLPPSHRTHSYISLPTPSSIRKDPHILLPLKLHPRQFYHQSFFQHSDERFRRRCSLQNATSDGQAIKTTMHFGKQGYIPFLSS
ncbi:hypothetical protein BLNAU_20362 [Blattamonas nauphoetae]|uniref:Uncharacterized protein n=1 Tax=Blattamonas nauphoetae TaxID=2049346 RepID=A0ABQ9X294_9EUKA|nr:hypothetical protein BLNAU_20362 [Blattamonas nauphoetae]